MLQWILKMFFLYLFIFFFGRHSGDDSVCSMNKSFPAQGGQITHYTENLCCPNYENISGKCRECKKGFTSEKGFNCSKCNSGYYGVQCFYKCDCPNQSCNHLDGCMQNPKTEGLKPYQPISSTVFEDISSLTEVNHGNTHIIIYIVCSGILTVVIGFGVVCLKRKHKMKKPTANRRSTKSGGTSKRELQILPPRENLQRFEDPYAVIDEQCIHSNP